MKIFFYALFTTASVFGVNHTSCDQSFENIKQGFLELTNTNEKILIDNHQLKLFNNRLMVELREDYLLPVSKLWQKKEGTFVTLSTDPDYQYRCMGCYTIYDYQPVECYVCGGGDFARIKR